jgi:SAM-dependent methyltransferase
LDTILCRICGLISHAQIPTDEELAQYYQLQYRQDYHGEYTPSSYRVAREWRRGQQLAQRLLPYLKSTDAILEIGSGIGCTVKNLELAGFDACGIEPGEGFVKFSRESLKASVRRASLSDLGHAPTCDVVLLVHVLEHLNAPRAALQHIWQLLRPGGRLYVEVPNAGAPHAAPGKIFHFAHIFNFTPATLRMLGRATGFEVQQLSRERDKNLMMLLHKSPRRDDRIEPQSYEQSLAAMRRFGFWSYHLRWNYLSDAAARLANRLASRWGSQGKLDAILRQIEQWEQQHPGRRSRPAA